MYRISLIFLISGVVVAIPATATVRHIPADYATIQAGIDASVNGDTVLVDTGYYFEDHLRFKGHRITLASRYLLTGDTADISHTIIQSAYPQDGDTIVVIDQYEDSTTQLLGFTLEQATLGIYVKNASPKVMYNIIRDNIGGDNIGVGVAWHGGEINLIGNIIKGNEVGYGTAIWADSCEGTIHHNIIVENWANGDNGIIWLQQTGAMSIYNNTISNNINPWGYAGNGFIKIINATGVCSLYNNIIAFNGSGLYQDGPISMANDYNNVYGNIDTYQDPENRDFVNCSPGPHDILLNPHLIEGEPFDYRLLPISPCVNTGNPTSPLDPDSSRSDMGALWPPFGSYAFIAGTVKDSLLASVANVTISVVNNSNRDTSIANGSFVCGPIASGRNYDLLFSKHGYWDTTLTGITVVDLDTTFLDDIILRADNRAADTIYVSGDFNGDGDATPLADLIYGANAALGGSPPPNTMCDSQYMPAVGDVNGNCYFTGIDIAYAVNYWRGGNALLHCGTCPPPHSDLIRLPSGTDPGMPDSIIIGNLDHTPTFAHPGNSLTIPVWVKTDEAVPALNIPLAVDTVFISQGFSIVKSNPLSGWNYCNVLPAEFNQPMAGYVTRTLLGWRLMSADSLCLNTNGDYRQVATLNATTSPNINHIGQITQIISSRNFRTGVTALCDSAGLNEWTPAVVGGGIYFATDSANMILSRTNFLITVPPTQSVAYDLCITNRGVADLLYELNEDSSWIELSSNGGDARGAETDTVAVTFHAEALAQGLYHSRITLSSNDPGHSSIVLPVTLAVGEPGCHYVAGDANNVGGFTGLDVTYSVRYFKGGSAPPYFCECTSGNAWFVAGDVNGSCSFTGLDITYMVRYFKGGPGPIPCPDCPPAGVILAPRSLLIPMETDMKKSGIKIEGK